MGERVKARLPVVGAHAAFPHAAKAHGAGGQMDDHIVDAAAAEPAPLRDERLMGLVRGEQVERQRLGPAVQQRHRILQPVVGQHRKNGAENLLLHHRILPADMIQQGGFQLAAILPHSAAADQLAFVHKGAEPPQMPLVDDAAIVGVLQRLRPVLAANFRLQGRHQPVMDSAVAQDIVGGHAGLAAVEKLAEHDAPGRQRDVGGLVHDAGAFAAQLQHGGGQCFSGVAQHLPAHRGAAREKHKVKFLFQKCGVFLPPAGDHRHKFRGKALLHQRRQHRRGGGGVGAGLDDGGVTRCDGVRQRVQCQQQGIVPGAHNQRHTVRPRLLVAAGGKLRQRRGDPVLGGAAADVAQLVGNFGFDQPHLA